MATAQSKLLDIEFYIAAAQHHGKVREPDLEVGDLQGFLRDMWALAPPELRLQFAKDRSVQVTLEATLIEDFEDEVAKLP